MNERQKGAKMKQTRNACKSPVWPGRLRLLSNVGLT